MPISEDPVTIAELIIKGGMRTPARKVSLEELRTVFRTVVARVERERTVTLVALGDGQAWVTFPELSGMLLQVVEPNGVRKGDFESLAAPLGVQIVGGDRRGAIRLLANDLVDAWPLSLVTAVVIVAVTVMGQLQSLADSLVQVVVLASGLFFAVFVLFGIGEVARGAMLRAKLYRTGQLQRFLDDDRYLVRLAIAGFALAMAAASWSAVATSLRASLTSLGRGGGTGWITDLPLALFMWGALVCLGLTLRAMGSYLVDRAAGTLLIELGRAESERARMRAVRRSADEHADGIPNPPARRA